MSFRDYLIESQLKQHIKGMLKLFQMSGKDVNPQQLKYWKWQDKVAKVVNCKSYKSDPTLEEIVNESFNIVGRPQKKECYRNSFMVAVQHQQIDLVVGYTGALGGAIPIEHAWNYYKPKKIYFDLTFELCLGKNPEKEHYLQIVHIPAKEATNILTSTRFTIQGFLGSWFMDKVLK